MRFRLLTYNIHRAIGLDRQFRPDRIEQILEHHDPDIVLLQEVDDGAPRSRELDLAKSFAETLDYPHYAVGHNVRLRKGRYGNATLSRFPILRERNVDLTIGTRKRRGCQHTTIELRARRGYEHELEVFNLHLGLSAREREQQIGRLVRSAEMARLDREAPCVVGGDFNDWRSLLRPIMVHGAAFDCATDTKTNPPRALKTYPCFSPRGGLDRVFQRGAIRAIAARTCRLAVSRIASDHLPVIVDFELI